MLSACVCVQNRFHSVTLRCVKCLCQCLEQIPECAYELCLVPLSVFRTDSTVCLWDMLSACVNLFNWVKCNSVFIVFDSALLHFVPDIGLDQLQNEIGRDGERTVVLTVSINISTRISIVTKRSNFCILNENRNRSNYFNTAALNYSIHSCLLFKLLYWLVCVGHLCDLQGLFSETTICAQWIALNCN